MKFNYFLTVALLFLFSNVFGFRHAPPVSYIKRQAYHPEMISSRLDLRVHRHSSALHSNGNFFGRVVRIVKSSVNSIIRYFEDPEKLIDQAISDMTKDLYRIRQSFAEVTASKKKMERQIEQTHELSNEWYRRAEVFIANGEEEMAREALARRRNQLDILSSISKQFETYNTAVEKLKASMAALESKIEEAKRQRELYIARAKSAKATIKVNEMLSSFTSEDTSVGYFEKMKSEIESLETMADISDNFSQEQLSNKLSLEAKFATMVGKSIVDQDLETLKKSMHYPKLDSSNKIPYLEAEVIM